MYRGPQQILNGAGMYQAGLVCSEREWAAAQLRAGRPFALMAYTHRCEQLAPQTDVANVILHSHLSSHIKWHPI